MMINHLHRPNAAETAQFCRTTRAIFDVCKHLSHFLHRNVLNNSCVSILERVPSSTMQNVANPPAEAFYNGGIHANSASGVPQPYFVENPEPTNRTVKSVRYFRS
jgi:hypothetical protein